MKAKKIVIIGAGLAGLSCAVFLKQKNIKSQIFEKEGICGGLCRSVKKGGFTFDLSGHLLHLKNQAVSSFVRDFLGLKLARHKRNSFVYFSRKFIPFPFQINFHRLPQKIVRKCLTGFLQARYSGNGCFNGRDLISWLKSSFGEAITRYFMVPYNTKFWKMSLDKLNFEWANRFMPKPTLETIVRGFLSNQPPGVGYSASFFYPVRGGVNQVIQPLSSNLNNITLQRKLIKIYPDKKQILLSNGKKLKYDVLILTIPLPELSRIIVDLPLEIKSIFSKLRWLSVCNINLGLSTVVCPGRHWIYFPQANLDFFRVGFYSNFSSSITPYGCGSLYADISYRNDRKIDKSKLIYRLKGNLLSLGILPANTRILAENINFIKYGYPIYDLDYNNSRNMIVSYLLSKDILTCGRYGSWRYLSMEDVILEAMKISALVSAKC